MGFRKNEFESSIDSHLTMVLFYKNQTGLSHVNVCTIFMYKQNVMYPAIYVSRQLQNKKPVLLILRAI